MIQDLTVGDSQKTLIGYTVPMFISVVFQQLYNIADSMIAGKFAGEDALAAVGASYRSMSASPLSCGLQISHTKMQGVPGILSV